MFWNMMKPPPDKPVVKHGSSFYPDISLDIIYILVSILKYILNAIKVVI